MSKRLILRALTYFIYLTPAYTSELIIHNLDSEYKFTGGAFPYNQDEDSIYTSPRQPQEAPPQSVRIYNGHPQEMPEMLRKRVRPNQDGRERVTATTKWPFLIHGQLSLYFGNKEYVGSGFMVGPHHLLTAGHNVYNLENGAWVDRVITRLALNDNVASFNEVEAAKIYTFEQWIKDANPDFDMALIVLKQQIGLRTGWCGLLATADNTLISEKVTITGYPGDKGSNQMWSMVHKIKSVQAERLYYDIDTYGGQSGSAIWINKWGSPYAVGVHAYGSLQDEGNSGARISREKLKAITRWISATKEFQQALSKNTPSTSQSSTEELDKVRTVAFLKDRAKEGDIEAQYQLGNCYYNGQGVEKDYTKAAYLYQRAANQGHRDALYSFTVCLCKGVGIKQDMHQAILFCQKAAELGHSEAQYQLAECLNKGILGIQIDKVKAVILYEKAARQGHLGSLYRLAVCFEKGEGMSVNLNKANFFYEKAAELGHADAQYRLGLGYKKGQGCEKDFTRAAVLFQLAANQGHVPAIYNLGNCYYNGQGVDKDYIKAVSHYQKAADQGNIPAMYNLGVCYYTGQGADKDCTKAFSFYQKAAYHGNISAIYNLGVCYENGEGVVKNSTEAKKLFQHAAAQGHADAQHRLGL